MFVHLLFQFAETLRVARVGPTTLNLGLMFSSLRTRLSGLDRTPRPHAFKRIGRRFSAYFLHSRFVLSASGGQFRNLREGLSQALALFPRRSRVWRERNMGVSSTVPRSTTRTLAGSETSAPDLGSIFPNANSRMNTATVLSVKDHLQVLIRLFVTSKTLQ